jgi:hypothetical protein
VAQIDALLLNDLSKRFLHRLILETPQLAQFIARTPKLQTLDEARVVFSDRLVEINPHRHIPDISRWEYSCRQSNWQVLCLAQSCSPSFPQVFIPTVEHLYICELLTDRVGKTTSRTANG